MSEEVDVRSDSCRSVEDQILVVSEEVDERDGAIVDQLKTRSL